MKEDIKELINKYEKRRKVVEEHCINRYNCKLVDGELIFYYDMDDEDNCMMSGYSEEYYTLKEVIKDLQRILDRESSIDGGNRDED